MGLMNKLNKMKSFLFDEEEEEKEEKRPSKKNSKKEEKKERKVIDDFPIQPKESIEELYFEDISEESVPLETEIQSRVEKKESGFNFPEFDDDDFMVASKKPEPIIPVVKEEPKRVLYQGSKRKEETKKFKPSPIISPIYGLLDNEGNKVKEDEPKEKSSSYNEDVTFDEVRKKAYGSLDEEIENTMKRLSKKTIEEAEKDMEKEELSRTKKKSNKKTEEKKASVVIVNNDEEDDDDMILPNVNFKEIDVDKETFRSSKEDVKKKEISREDDDDDDTKEQDLFNLIDTMYQNKEDED